MGKRRTGGIKRKLPCPNKTQLVPSQTSNKNQGKNLNPGLDKAGLIEGWAWPTLLILRFTVAVLWGYYTGKAVFMRKHESETRVLAH